MDIFLGEPPANIKAWIIKHYGPGPAPSELGIPLYFSGNESGASVAMLCQDDFNGAQINLKCHLQYSTDKLATWAAYDGSIVYLDDCTDNKVYFRADPNNPNTDGFCKQDYANEEAWTHYFKTDKSVKAGGNIQFLLESTGTRTDVPEYGFSWLFAYNSECTSLTQAPQLPATTLANNCYSGMFRNCASLTVAPQLPATTLAVACYEDMLRDCTSLTTAPALLATTLVDNCYWNMFQGCTSLAAAPELPATALGRGCYSGMFQGCTKLVAAPELPATTLANNCYWNMFQGCTSLAAAPELPATALGRSCYLGMFRNCASLTVAPQLPATTLVDNCYNGMFHGCTKLASIDVSFSAWNPSTATTGWVTNAGSQATGTKTFTCPAALPQTIGNNNIPDGWTVVTK